MSWEKMGLAKVQGRMGFRDLICFNKPLLAKQSWRIMQNPESLAAKIIKAKYFRNCSFLEANLGNRSSYAWRSILAGRALFQEGCVWRIGDGQNVHIWGDKWIPKPSTYAIQSPCKILPKDAKVVELLEEDTNQWNLQLVRNIFSEEEAEIIGNIPVSKYKQKDKLIWLATTNGEFSVRSAYHLEKEIQDRKNGESSNQARYQAIWKRIWGLKVPNATKVFLWRACHNILSTKENLKKRKVVEDDLCIFCCQEQESVFHITWACPSAQDVWGASARSFQKSRTDGLDFVGLFEEIMENLGEENLLIFAVTAKEIWQRRNLVLHGGVVTHPNIVANLAMEALRQFQHANSKDPSQENEEGLIIGDDGPCPKWRAPTHGFYKANWDIAISLDKKCMGIGVIIRDEEGLVTAAKSLTISAVLEPAAGEAMAALHAAELCRDLGIF
jgi:hypothetical protein